MNSIEQGIADLSASAINGKDAFKAVVVASGDQAQVRAQRVLARLAGKLTPGCEFQSTIWKLALLNTSPLMSFACEEAIEADLVVIALEDSSDLPAPLKAMLERWAHESRKGAVLLAGTVDFERANDGLASGSALMVNFFRQIATTRGFDFYCEAGGLTPASTRRARPAARLLPEGSFDTAILLAVPDEPPGRRLPNGDVRSTCPKEENDRKASFRSDDPSSRWESACAAMRRSNSAGPDFASCYPAGYLELCWRDHLAMFGAGHLPEPEPVSARTLSECESTAGSVPPAQSLGSPFHADVQGLCVTNRGLRIPVLGPEPGDDIEPEYFPVGVRHRGCDRGMSKSTPEIL